MMHSMTDDACIIPQTQSGAAKVDLDVFLLETPCHSMLASKVLFLGTRRQRRRSEILNLRRDRDAHFGGQLSKKQTCETSLNILIRIVLEKLPPKRVRLCPTWSTCIQRWAYAVQFFKNTLHAFLIFWPWHVPNTKRTCVRNAAIVSNRSLGTRIKGYYRFSTRRHVLPFLVQILGFGLKLANVSWSLTLWNVW
jgi:hypothetical protein